MQFLCKKFEFLFDIFQRTNIIMIVMDTMQLINIMVCTDLQFNVEVIQLYCIIFQFGFEIINDVENGDQDTNLTNFKSFKLISCQTIFCQ